MLRSEKLPGFDVECVLAKGIRLESVPGPTGSTVLYLQPCATVEGRVNCELRFGLPGKGVREVFYDLPILSHTLNTYSENLVEVRVSPNLGVARVQWRGKKILISRNGRIVIREAVDEEDAKATIDFLSRLLAPSIVCDRCGQVILNCAMASCGECAMEQASLAPLTNNILWTGGVERIQNFTRALIGRIDSLDKEVTRGESITSSYGPLFTEVDRIARDSLGLIVDSSNREELAVGVLLLGQAWDLSLILGLLDQIHRGSSSDRGSLVMPLLRMLELWLLALKESLDGVVDEGARESPMKRWAHVSEAWSNVRRRAENDSALKVFLSPLVERWPV